MKRVEQPVYACPIEPVVDLVFGRWTSHVLWALAHNGRLRFTELQAQIPGITPKVLTERLRQLERDGLVARTYHREIPPRVEYEMTALGQTLVPVFRTASGGARPGWAPARLARPVSNRLNQPRALPARPVGLAARSAPVSLPRTAMRATSAAPSRTLADAATATASRHLPLNVRSLGDRAGDQGA